MGDKDDHPRPSSQGPDAVAPQSPSCLPPDQTMPPASAHSRPLISTLGWELDSIVESSPNFHHIKRVHFTSPNAKVDVVIPEVELEGNPLIIQGWNRHPRWPKSLFNIDWLKKHGDQNPTVRNIHTWSDFKIPMDDFIKKTRDISLYAGADEQERLYGKDGECPSQWAEWLKSGAIPEDLLFDGPNDFLKFLPDKAKVQTLMCYMGIGDTFTPFHKDLCASSGQNLMCFSEHGGSAFWFMTKSSAAPQVAAYFHQLGHEVDLETHVVTLEELSSAPFDVYIAEQQQGDLVLVPPRSCHQVVNKGGITIKTSWSRMSLRGLQTALWHELPIYHRVCRQEIYKVKSNIFHALQHFIGLVENLPERHKSESCPTSAVHLKQLVSLFDDILASEFSIARDSMPHVSQPGMPHTDDLHCDFCGADIFQSFFECDSCLPASSSEVSAPILPIGDGLTICPTCYVEGRTCQCEDMQPGQCRSFSDLLNIRDQAIRAIQRIDSDYINIHGYLLEQPLQLLSERDANVFEAACKLRQKRQHTDINVMKSCRLRLPHQVPTPAAIYCRLCHFSKCYTHMLDIESVHSVDALTISGLADGDVNWHQCHRDNLQRYEEVRQRAIEDERRGSRPNPLHKLTYLAKTYTTCRAIAFETTKHGWYDRFVQPTSVPIANSPAKALVGLPEEKVGSKPYGSRALNDSPSSNTAVSAPGSDSFQNAFPYRTLANALPISPTPPRHADKVQLPGHSVTSAILNPHSPIDPMHFPATFCEFQAFNSPTNTSVTAQRDIPSSLSSLRSSPRRYHVASPLGLATTDDPGNLSDLTDLPSELGSPPRSSMIPTIADQSLPMEMLSSPSAAKDIAKTHSGTGSKSKPRVVLDYVEISQSSQQKRRRITGSFVSNVVGPPDSDISPSAAQEMDNQSLPQRKRKMPKGPASRSSSSSKRTRFPFDARDRSPSNNILANALNQTFQLNSTTAASHVSTTPLVIDAIPPVNSTVKPKYRDFGVQKHLNFTRHTSTSQPSEDPSSCIMRLEAKNRDLRSLVEAREYDCERYRDNLEELQRRYNFSGPRHLPQSTNFTPQTPVEFSAHPRWRMRGTISTEGQLQSSDLDHPPIETLPLPTPSSPESGSPAYHRRTPTAPRNFGMRVRGDASSHHAQPYTRPQSAYRRRRASYSGNGKKPRTRLQGPHSFDHNERMTEGPAPSNTAEADVSGISPTVDGDRTKVPPSPPSTA